MHYLLKKLNTRVGVLFSVSLIIAGVLTPTIFAQTNQPGAGTFNFSTTPVVANLNVKPGETVSTKIQIKNNGLATEKVKVGLLKLSSNDKDGAPVLKDTEPNDDFVNWVKFSENTFDAEPDVWKTIDVTISPPAAAAFGYYYAINFSRISGQDPGSPTNISASIAVPLLLDVTAPGAVRKADITNFTVNKNVFEFLPATFNVTLKNSGNTHVAPRGNIFITKGGKNVGLIEVNQAKGNIIPNSIRQFGSDWNDGSPAYVVKEVDGKPVTDKDGNRVYTLSWSKFDAGKLRFGKYHAKIAMVYDDGTGDVSTEAEIDFWVIPWRILGVLLVVLLLIGAGLWATLLRPLRSRLKSRKGKTQTSNHE